jgi:hypothetical protein
MRCDAEVCEWSALFLEFADMKTPQNKPGCMEVLIASVTDDKNGLFEQFPPKVELEVAGLVFEALWKENRTSQTLSIRGDYDEYGSLNGTKRIGNSGDATNEPIVGT